MNKERNLVLIFCLVILTWFLLFPAAQGASSSPLLGFTLTPTAPAAASSTAVVPSNTPVVPSNTPVVPSNTPVSPSQTPVATSISLTDTPVSPSKTPGNSIPTLPPPSSQPGVLIPVTGADRSAAAGSSLLITTGLVVALIGLACLGYSRRKK